MSILAEARSAPDLELPLEVQAAHLIDAVLVLMSPCPTLVVQHHSERPAGRPGPPGGAHSLGHCIRTTVPHKYAAPKMSLLVYMWFVTNPTVTVSHKGRLCLQQQAPGA